MAVDNNNISDQSLDDEIVDEVQLNHSADTDGPLNIGDDLIVFEDSRDGSGYRISHSPLNLGNSPSPANPKISTTRSNISSSDSKKKKKKKAAKLSSDVNRITGIKTFFAKLHPGSMYFLEKQVDQWLSENPGVVIKQTSSTTGMVLAKKTEPNLILTVWY